MSAGQLELAAKTQISARKHANPVLIKKIKKSGMYKETKTKKEKEKKKCRVQTKKKKRKHFYLHAFGVCTPMFVDHFNAVTLTVASHTGRLLLLWALK